MLQIGIYENYKDLKIALSPKEKFEKYLINFILKIVKLNKIFQKKNIKNFRIKCLMLLV